MNTFSYQCGFLWFTQLTADSADHLNTELAHYSLQKINGTNAFVVVKQLSSTRIVNTCQCVRSGNILPPPCTTRIVQAIDRYHPQQLLELNYISFARLDDRCECPCFSRDLNFDSCLAQFTTSVLNSLLFSCSLVSCF